MVSQNDLLPARLKLTSLRQNTLALMQDIT